jgi:hypothetical protein
MGFGCVLTEPKLFESARGGIVETGSANQATNREARKGISRRSQVICPGTRWAVRHRPTTPCALTRQRRGAQWQRLGGARGGRSSIPRRPVGRSNPGANGKQSEFGWTTGERGGRNIGRVTGQAAAACRCRWRLAPQSPIAIFASVRNAAGAQRKMAPGKPGPSLNREASRLGDVRVRRPSSRAEPGNLYWQHSNCQKTVRREPSRARNMDNSSDRYHREFRRPRLQKAQSSAFRRFHFAAGRLFSVQLTRVSATLRSRKSRKTLIRFEVRNSSG